MFSKYTFHSYFMTFRDPSSNSMVCQVCQIFLGPYKLSRLNIVLSNCFKQKTCLSIIFVTIKCDKIKDMKLPYGLPCQTLQQRRLDKLPAQVLTKGYWKDNKNEVN